MDYKIFLKRLLNLLKGTRAVHLQCLGLCQSPAVGMASARKAKAMSGCPDARGISNQGKKLTLHGCGPV